jgi:VWFA-related protein
MRRVTWIALALAALVALWDRVPTTRVFARGDAQAPVFRANADVVTVDVSVQRGGRPVAGLEAADFDLTDNGVRQDITLSYGTLPVDVTVLLDISGSVAGQVIEQLRRSVEQLRQDLTPQDRLRLVAFNMRVTRLVDVDAPAADVDKAFASLVAGGSSAVIDALTVALVSPAAADRRSFITLFSDGLDSSSITSPSTLLDVARRTSPTVSVVLATTAVRDKGDLYTDVASETGGAVSVLRPGESLGSTFRRLLEQFRSSYLLRFSPQGVTRVGSHTLNVRVSREGVEVRARRGYVLR